jgi:hypothetical protein
MIDPLTGEAWESKHPAKTITARLLWGCVQDAFRVRNMVLDYVRQGELVPLELLWDFWADQDWLWELTADHTYSLNTFCEVFGCRAADIRDAYYTGKYRVRNIRHAV